MNSEKKIDLEAEEVIERLGGNARTAELCEVTPGAVSQWLTNGLPKSQRKFLRLARPDVFKPRKAKPSKAAQQTQ